jgi:hypothetical protein
LKALRRSRRESGDMGLRGWLKRLERDARGEMIEIPQRDGSVARFPQSAAREAYANLMDRMGAQEDVPPEHPLIAAARNSSDPEWSESFYACNHERWTDPIEDHFE